MSIRLKTVLYKAVLLSMVLGLLGFTIALAAPGDLDTTFSGDGLVTSYVVPSNPGRGDVVEGIAIQSNDKIVAVGYSYVPSSSTSDFALTQYNPDGSLDTTFSGDGRVITNFGGYDSAFDVAIQSNGKIVVAGQKCVSDICDVALARYNQNGALDATFSGDGKQIFDFGGRDNGSFGGLAIQSNGKIVVAGYIWNGTNYDMAIYRFNTNGTPDTTFSGDGVAVGNFGPGRRDDTRDLVLQSDGKIVVVGLSGDVNGDNNDFAIARLNENGTADTTFSGDGRVTTNFGGDEVAWGLDLQSNGKIVVAGAKSNGTLLYFVVARYNANGNLDTTFNGTGKKVFSVIPGAWSYARDVKVLSNGKIVVSGATANGSLSDFAVVRLNSGGGFDSTFSGDGKVTVGFESYDEGEEDFGSTLAVQPVDGKYVLGGYIHNFSEAPEFGLARVLP